ncbi:hypothetical protein ABTX71_12760 [Streptomyces parvulus]|uniref:hypothetical protein n=1 Tax=Streptomyces parvulus TaxID=146923 RepID=UPI003328FD97
MSAPLVVNTRDGSCWTRRTVLKDGTALYALADICQCPELVMATQAELADIGIVGSADALPMPVGPEPSAAGGFRIVVELSAADGRSDAEWAAELAENALEGQGFKVTVAVDEGEQDTAALRARVAELEAAQGTVYRAEHPDSGITLGHYGTEAAARAHCEETERRSWPTGTTLSFGWIRDALPEDEENGVAELLVTAGQNEESATGYIVTALELDSEYDPEAAE